MGNRNRICIGPVLEPASVFTWYDLDEEVVDQATIFEWIEEQRAEYPEFDEWVIVDWEGPLGAYLANKGLLDLDDLMMLVDDMNQEECSICWAIISDGRTDDWFDAMRILEDSLVFVADSRWDAVNQCADWHEDIHEVPEWLEGYVDWQAMYRDMCMSDWSEIDLADGSIAVLWNH